MARRNFALEFEPDPCRAGANRLGVRLAIADVAKNTIDEKPTAEERAYQQHHPRLEDKEKLACRQKLAAAMETVTETAGSIQRAAQLIHAAADQATASLDKAGWTGCIPKEVRTAQTVAAAAEVAADAACLVAEIASRLLWRAIAGPLFGLGYGHAGAYATTKMPTVPDEQNGRVSAALHALAKMETLVPSCAELARLRAALFATACGSRALARAIAVDHDRPEPSSILDRAAPHLTKRINRLLHAAAEGHRRHGQTCAEMTARTILDVAAAVQMAEHCAVLAASVLFAAEVERRSTGVHAETKEGLAMQAAVEEAFVVRSQSFDAVVAAQWQAKAVLASAKAHTPLWARLMSRCRR